MRGQAIRMFSISKAAKNKDEQLVCNQTFTVSYFKPSQYEEFTTLFKFVV